MKKKRSFRQVSPYLTSYKKSNGNKKVIIVCFFVICFMLVLILNYNSIFGKKTGNTEVLQGNIDNISITAAQTAPPPPVTDADGFVLTTSTDVTEHTSLPETYQPEQGSDNLTAPPLETTEEVTNAPEPIKAGGTPLGFFENPNSACAALFDAATLEVIAKKGIDEKIYPASMTKILTTVVLLENLTDMEEKITIKKDLLDALAKEDASVAGFLADEQVRVIDLLYGVLLPSGAECCISLAQRVSGSEAAFVELMNQKCAAIGLSATHFTNTTGLHDDNHYSTVREIAKILQYALKNETFRKIFTAKKYSTAVTNKHSKGITVKSSMFNSIADPILGECEILGGKTGFTDEAGMCLASLASDGYGREYILVTAGAPVVPKTEENPKPEPLSITDAKAVFSNISKQGQ